MSVNIGAIGLSALEGAGLVALQSIVGTGPKRQIYWTQSNGNGGSANYALTPTVIVHERSVDEMTITDHPVELGAAISDHAYLRPAVVALRAGWSEAGQSGSFSVSGLVSSLIPSVGDPTYLTRLYDRLRQLQRSRARVSLVTGKRIYNNMMLQSLSVPTDQTSEYVLNCDAVFREIIIVQTQTVTLADASVHAAPQSTAPMVNRGTLQPQAAQAP